MFSKVQKIQKWSVTSGFNNLRAIFLVQVTSLYRPPQAEFTDLRNLGYLWFTSTESQAIQPVACIINKMQRPQVPIYTGSH